MLGRPVALVLAAGSLAAAVGLGGCSGSTTNPGPSVPPTTTTGVVLSSQPSPVGPILATGNGFTLYDFASDTPGHSTCVTPICVTLWPPLLVRGTVTLGPRVDPGLVGTIRRNDGTTQVTYAGHPLYTWRLDSRPGWITGQALLNAGGYWYVVSTSGRPIKTGFRIGGSSSPSGAVPG